LEPLAEKKAFKTQGREVLADLEWQKIKMDSFGLTEHIYIIRIDLNGNYTYANDFFKRVFLRPGENLEASNALSHIDPQDHEPTLEIVEKALQNHGQVFKINLKKPLPDKDESINTKWEFTALADSFGIVKEIQCLGYDMTESENNELKLSKAKEEQELILKNSTSLSLLLGEDFVIQVSKGHYNLLSSEGTESLVGTNFKNFVLPTDIPKWEAFLTRYLKGTALDASLKIRLINNDGQALWANIMLREINPIFEKQPSCYLLILREVTKEHQLEKEKNVLLIQTLEALEDLKFYQKAMDRHALVSVIDPTGHYLYVNEYFCQINGYNINELIGKNIDIIKSNNHPESFYASIWKTLNSGNIWQGEHQNKKKDGSFYWVKSSILPKFDKRTSKITSFINIQTDISDQKNTEIELLNSQNNLNNTLNSINQEVWSVNTDYELTIFNRLFQKNFIELFNYQLKPKQNILELESLPKETAKRYKERYDRAFKGEKHTYFDEYIDPISQQTVYTEVRVLPTINQNGEISGATMYSENITNRKVQEEELRELLLRFELTTKSNNLSIWDYDLISSKLIWDENMFKLYEIEDKVDMTWDEWTLLLEPKSRQVLQNDFDKALQSDSNNFISSFQIKNGNKSITCLAKILRDEKGKAYRAIGLNWDISKTVQYEENLRQSLKEKENILNSINDGFIVLDQHLQVTSINKSACNILDVTEKEVLGKSLWAEPEDQKQSQFYSVFKKCLDTNTGANVNGIDRVSKNWIDATVYPRENGLVIFFKDITIEKIRSIELEKVRNNQAALINTTRDLIWSVNTNLELVAFNEQFSLHQTEIGALLPLEGRMIFNKHSANYIKQWKRRYQKALAGETVIKTIEENSLIYSFSLYPIINANNEVEGVACYARDITETEAYLNAIEMQNNELKNIAWMQSHIVRAPIARILGLVELIKDEQLIENHNLNSYLQSINSSAVELDDIVEKITKKTYSANIKGI
jgi:PAS domain S-box-containing protein